MHNYEVEIKVLLGTEAEKNIFMDRVRNGFSGLLHKYSESQKNHYFAGGSLDALLAEFRPLVNSKERQKLENIRDIAKSYSVRTRGTSTQTIIVVKATVNDESSSNGTARIEWEVDLAPMTIEEMDTLVLSASFTYQAKWSRAREVYQLNTNTILCLDKNAGYGYLAEFERVIEDVSLVDSTCAELSSIIESLGYVELDQTRLERMFDFYNKNWAEYYGTDNVFIVK